MTLRTHSVQFITLDNCVRTVEVKADEMEVDEGVLTLFRDGEEVAIFTRCIAVIADWSDA